nr:hypothetical protein CFP56_57598 [Quercus suber]
MPSNSVSAAPVNGSRVFASARISIKQMLTTHGLSQLPGPCQLAHDCASCLLRCRKASKSVSKTRRLRKTACPIQLLSCASADSPRTLPSALPTSQSQRLDLERRRWPLSLMETCVSASASTPQSFAYEHPSIRTRPDLETGKRGCANSVSKSTTLPTQGKAFGV